MPARPLLSRSCFVGSPDAGRAEIGHIVLFRPRGTPGRIMIPAMTAFLLLVALTVGISAYVGWAAREIAHGAAVWGFVVAAPVVYFAPAIVLVAVWSVLTWIWRTPRPPEARIGPIATARLFLTEVWTL